MSKINIIYDDGANIILSFQVTFEGGTHKPVTCVMLIKCWDVQSEARKDCGRPHLRQGGSHKRLIC